MARTTKDPDERRSELVASAQRLFYSKGYESTSVNDIVTAVGVAKGTFYYYFDSKQAILEAMIDDLLAQSIAIMHEIVSDETLSAAAKWRRAMKVLGNWKTARKSEMIALLKTMQTDENALLKYKVQGKTVQILAPELAQIIEQGVAEGVFNTEYPQDSAEIAIAILLSSQDAIANIILYPQDYENPALEARRRLNAIQGAVERIIGAEKGSLPFFDEKVFTAWFTARDLHELEKVL
jgi:AcrR family transcriptional regulator